MEHYAYIETFGCQMNERDSEIMGQLLAENYHQTRELDQAEIVVVNTCSIRDKAEQKAFSLLGHLRLLKQKNPKMVIAVAGCVAQQEGEALKKRMPHVDLVVGPQNIYRLPAMLENLKNNRRQTVATELSPAFVIPPFLPSMATGNPIKRFITIMQGCNNFCTYCIVPYTRGREISRNFDEIVDEAAHLAANGVKELTLLGQNVNSYDGPDQQGRHRDFPELLHAIAGINGIERIRFTTSHPKDLSENLMQCFVSIPKLCSHIHLPVQSGSNAILRRMNRRYTIESYLDKVLQLRRLCPDIAITTDIIVGFPGETENDFRETMDLLETVRYHGAFSFKYSDRPQAKATRLPDKILEPEKSRRLAILQARQNEISHERHEEFIGQKMQVLVEGESKNADGQWSGRTRTNHIVNFSGALSLVPGDLVMVRIREACLNSLRGEAEDD